MGKPILCVDFDGVIHSYTSGWKGATVIPDPPVPGALRWLWKATEWFDVKIYSSRSKEDGGCAAMLDWMVAHSKEEFGEGHPMASSAPYGAWLTEATGELRQYPIDFCHEKPSAFLTIDDRAVCFEGDWSDLEPADLLNFKPWYKRELLGAAVRRLGLAGK